ncbi:MAG: Inner rane protein YbaL, partial [Caulobacteraceae bacterium]|nr:Inner rane protein YbaL [Caulobacteraceae bacterium]
MVVLTVFTVGYGEVRPIDTAALRILTLTDMFVGCTGMILLTGALVQVFTVGQIKQLLGMDKATSEIDRLKDHVIICGFGRIGVMLAKDLKDGRSPFVVVERDEARIHQARALGYLCLQADAAEEASLVAAGIHRARVLASVLPADSTNVFITLTARSLNAKLQIIARGEQPSTESKLIYAGADKVVLPTHIGAERIAELILFPETARFIRGSERMRDFDKTLRELGLHLEMVAVPEGSGAIGASIEEIERRGKGGFHIVQLDRQGGEIITRPPMATRLVAGDGVLVVARVEMAAVMAVFQAPPERVRAGRGVF